ncbi:voltage-gated sodium channel type II beta [Sarotherodon galilaeus]
MEDAGATAGKLMPAALNMRMVNSNNNGLRQTSSQEMECANVNEENSPQKKKKKAPSLESASPFETIAAGVSKVLSVLVLEFAETLRERAAADTSQMKELEAILAEARNLEARLKEKKKHLKETLALISDKLEG